MNKRTKWFELSLPSEHTHWSLYLAQPSDGWDERRYRLVIGFYRFFLSMNLWKTEPHSDFESEPARYGFSFFERSIHLYLGQAHVYSLPWDWTIVRHDLLLPDGSLYFRNTYPRRSGEQHRHWYDVFEKSANYVSGAQIEAVKYVNLTHTTKSGTVQKARIRLCGEEREWRWKWLRWLPRPRITRRVVDCTSDIELGEKAGSWKGGLMGWSCPWPRGYTMEESFWMWYYDQWDGK